MTETIQEQLNDVFTQDATPNSALAILWMDTAYRLAGIMLKRINTQRAKDKLPPLSPSLNDLHNSLAYIGSFDTYFDRAELKEDGKPDWSTVDRNKNGLLPIAYNMYSELTSKLLAHADELKGVKMGYAAQGVITERSGGEPYLPDDSGPVMTDFAQPVASKVAFYAYKLMSILRSNGGANEFPPKSQSTTHDILNVREVTIQDVEDTQDDPVEIDHMDLDWDITTMERLKERDVFKLSGTDLAEAQEAKECLDAWGAVYDKIHDSNEALDEEVTYQVALSKQWIEDNRKTDNSPVKGALKRTADESAA